MLAQFPPRLVERRLVRGHCRLLAAQILFARLKLPLQLVVFLLELARGLVETALVGPELELFDLAMESVQFVFLRGPLGFEFLRDPASLAFGLLSGTFQFVRFAL